MFLLLLHYGMKQLRGQLYMRMKFFRAGTLFPCMTMWIFYILDANKVVINKFNISTYQLMHLAQTIECSMFSLH